MKRLGRSGAFFALLATLGCAGYSASHGPRPVEPGHEVFAAGVSLITDTGDSGVLLLPELSYRTGVTDRIDAGLEVAGLSAMADALAVVWEDEPWVLSAGLGASTVLGSFGLAAVHPEAYFGTDALFIAARPMVFIGRASREDAGSDGRLAKATWPGLSVGTTLGRAECTHVLPTASAFFDETAVLVLTVNVRFPKGYDCD